MSSDWIKSLVNYSQSSEERRAKYDFVSTLSEGSGTPNRMRDWRWSKIFRYFGLISEPLTKAETLAIKSEFPQKDFH